MFNRYAYCRNNPLIYVDPSGLEDDDIGGILGVYLDGTDEDHTVRKHPGEEYPYKVGSLIGIAL